MNADRPSVESCEKIDTRQVNSWMFRCVNGPGGPRSTAISSAPEMSALRPQNPAVGCRNEADVEASRMVSGWLHDLPNALPVDSTVIRLIPDYVSSLGQVS